MGETVDFKLDSEKYNKLQTIANIVDPSITRTNETCNQNNSYYWMDTFTVGIATLLCQLIPRPHVLSIDWFSLVNNLVDQIGVDAETMNDLKSQSYWHSELNGSYYDEHYFYRVTISGTYKHTKSWFFGYWVSVDTNLHSTIVKVKLSDVERLHRRQWIVMDADRNVDDE